VIKDSVAEATAISDTSAVDRVSRSHLATRIPIRVRSPDDHAIDTHWSHLPDGTGLVDFSTTCPTPIDRSRALTAHTRGFGQAIAAALDHGVHRLILTIGGSCPATDGGVGALRELGAAFLDKQDRPIRDGGVGLIDLAVIDLSGIRRQPAGAVIVIHDAPHPLPGRNCAAQMSATPAGTTPPNRSPCSVPDWNA